MIIIFIIFFLMLILLGYSSYSDSKQDTPSKNTYTNKIITNMDESTPSKIAVIKKYDLSAFSIETLKEMILYYDYNFSIGSRIHGKIEKFLVKELYFNNKTQPNAFHIFLENNHQLLTHNEITEVTRIKQRMTGLYSFAKPIMTSGWTIEEVKQYLDRSVNSLKSTMKLDDQKSLDNLIGLNNIKDFINKLKAQILIQKEREKHGLHVNMQNLHMIFLGNPGTGKTEVARIIGNLFYELGVLKTNKFIETDRSGLVGQYLGETALKTHEIVNSALDGVLFIDEAYSLGNDVDSNHSYGKEAIDALIKDTEDFRNRLVVILAGYPEEMNNFLNTNPGLYSRFPNQITFNDYDNKELIEIVEKWLNDYHYTYTPQAKIKLKEIFEDKRIKPGFGNARFVRNILEEAVRNQAYRIEKLQKFDKSTLMTIIEEDIPVIQ